MYRPCRTRKTCALCTLQAARAWRGKGDEGAGAKLGAHGHASTRTRPPPSSRRWPRGPGARRRSCSRTLRRAQTWRGSRRRPLCWTCPHSRPQPRASGRHPAPGGRRSSRGARRARRARGTGAGAGEGVGNASRGSQRARAAGPAQRGPGTEAGARESAPKRRRGAPWRGALRPLCARRTRLLSLLVLRSADESLLSVSAVGSSREAHEPKFQPWERQVGKGESST